MNPSPPRTPSTTSAPAPTRVPAPTTAVPAPAPAPAPVASEADRQPTLKVMRLYKPRLQQLPLALGCAPPFTPPVQQEVCVDSVNRGFSLSNSFVLPDSFGNIYLGETFCSYISVLNHFQHTLANVSLTAKLQTPSCRLDLEDSRPVGPYPDNPCAEFKAGQHLDMVVKHTLSELGTHTLRVCVSYANDAQLAPLGRTSEPKSLRKFYRFNVLNPVQIQVNQKTMVQGEHARGLVHVQVRLQNLAKNALLLHRDSVVFHAGEDFVSQDLLARENGGEGGANDGRGSSVAAAAETCVVLAPQDVHQFIFQARAKKSRPPVVAGSVLGHVEVRWTSTLGEAGTIRSQPVEYQPLNEPPGGSPRLVAVSVDGLPSEVVLGHLCKATCNVTNHSDRAMTLQLQLRREAMAGVFVSGHSCQNMGLVPPGATKSCPIELLPLVAGLHPLRGILAVEPYTAQEFAQDNVLELLVVEE